MMEPDSRSARHDLETPQAQTTTEAPVDPFWAIGVGLAVLFAVGAVALATG